MLTLDARNHGNSPHSPVLTYDAMAEDLKHLLAQLRIEKCVLVGHSMGGKTAMVTALTQVRCQMSPPDLPGSILILSSSSFI